MAGVITLGLSQIKVADATVDGTKVPELMAKIGKTYKDTCKLNQDAAEVTEHFEEGASAPEVSNKSKKVPKLTFSIMDPDPQLLADYVGGEVTDADGVKNWGFNGDEKVDNKAIYVETEQGLDFYIPNGSIEAIVSFDISSKGIGLLEMTVTPMAVTTGKAIQGITKKVAGK